MRRFSGGRIPDIRSLFEAGGDPASVRRPCHATGPAFFAGNLQPCLSRRDIDHEKPDAVLADNDLRTVRRRRRAHDTVELSETSELPSALGIPNTATASTTTQELLVAGQKCQVA